jgi:hypothetical protein
MTRKQLAVVFGLGLSALGGCDATPPVAAEVAPSASAAQAPAPTEQAAPGAVASSLAQQKFGEPITETTETSLASISSAPADFANKTVRTTGLVTAVCKAAGCWMEIGDETSKAHIKMAGHKFLVPRTSNGHRAIVQGIVSATEAENSCGAKDNCGGPEHGANAKLEIVATGVEFID